MKKVFGEGGVMTRTLKRNVIIVAAVLLIGVAVYLNYLWFYSPDDGSDYGNNNMVDANGTNTDDTPTGGEDDTDYGERLLQAGEVAPDFTIITDEYPDGIALAGLRGNYVLIEFWRSTCGDCRDVTPDMKRIYSTYAPRGLVVLGVSFDQNEDEWRAYIEENGLGWMQHREQTTASESPVGTAYHIDWTPTFYLIDPQGRIDLATIYVDDGEKRLEETDF